METEDGIYLFKTMEGVENALSNWLGEEFEDDSLTLLGVELPPEAQKRLNEQGDDHASYEIVVTTTIPSQYIQILSEDI
jgi:fatty acid/phospholipid biosynthesis enzyme